MADSFSTELMYLSMTELTGSRRDRPAAAPGTEVMRRQQPRGRDSSEAY